MSLMAFTVGVGYTVTLNVVTGPVHPLAVAVTLTVAVIGLLVLFVMVVKAPMFPLLPRPKPTSVVLVQLYVAPGVELLKLIAAPVAPLQ